MFHLSLPAFFVGSFAFMVGWLLVDAIKANRRIKALVAENVALRVQRDQAFKALREVEASFEKLDTDRIWIRRLTNARKDEATVEAVRRVTRGGGRAFWS